MCSIFVFDFQKRQKTKQSRIKLKSTELSVLFCAICLSICTVCQDIPDEETKLSSSHNSSTSGTIMQGCGVCGRFLRSILCFCVILCCIKISLFFVSMCKQGVYMQKSPKTGLCFFGQSFLQNIAPIIQLVMPPHKNKVAKMPSIFVTKGLPASC